MSKIVLMIHQSFSAIMKLLIILLFGLQIGASWRHATISYKNNEVTPSEVESLIQKLKAECNCDVEHLSAIGALILTNIECEKEDIMKHLDDRMNIDFIQPSG